METVEQQLKGFSDVLESKSQQNSNPDSPEKRAHIDVTANNPDINYVSPFQLPTDEEVFLYREREKQKKMDMKMQGSKTKIWDKKTASSKHQLHLYKKFEGEKEEANNKNKRKSQGYNTKDQTLIKTAMEIIKDRGKQREQIVKKEGVVELIEQKKEMFLVTMSHGILENEIERLKEIYREKKSALEQSEKIMEHDNEEFHRHWENDKANTEAAQHKAELESKEKKIKEAQFKTLSVKLTSLQTDITRFDEQVSNSREHKEFLDKLASKDWHEQKQMKRDEVIAKAKEAFIQRELQNMEEEKDESESQNTYYQRGGVREKKQGVKNKSITSMRETAEEKFNQLLKDGEIDEVEDFENEYGMYFKEPHQLLDYFSMLEEKSLFLIQMSQDSEQNLEELKAEYKKKREDLEYKIKNLNETKSQKKKQLEELNKSIIQLRSQRDEHKQAKTRDELLGPISKKLLELFNQIKENGEMCSSLKLNTSNWTDIENKSTMDILSIIESIIRLFLKKIKEYREVNNEKVESLAKIIRSKRKKEIGDDKNKLYELKKSKTSKEGTETQKGKKHIGRIIMTRSAPADKEEVKEEEVVDNAEEEEKKFFE